MAPNKRSLAYVAQSLSSHDLTGMVKHAYLPLTFEIETLVEPMDKLDVVSSTKKEVTNGAASEDYWNWSSPSAVEALSDTEQESYWDEPSHACSSPSAYENYWDWNQNPRADVLSLAYIESNVKAFVDPEVVRYSTVDSESYWNESSVKDTEAGIIYSDVESHEYWYTPNTITGVSTKTASSTDAASNAEYTRHLLSAKHMQERERQAYADSYWEWEETLQEELESYFVNYWDWNAEARPVSLAPNNYWDM
jgi:hypothetical protein